VLSANPYSVGADEVVDIRVLMTIVDGKIEYEASK